MKLVNPIKIQLTEQHHYKHQKLLLLQTRARSKHPVRKKKHKYDIKCQNLGTVS